MTRSFSQGEKGMQAMTGRLLSTRIPPRQQRRISNFVLPDAAALRERLLAKCIPEPNSGCWLWLGAVRDGGYGGIKINRRVVRAHRVALEVFTGTPVPDNLCVCHRCDVPACINPDHLFVGTASDNMRDMWSKGRGILRPEFKPGVKNGNARLTDDVVLAIRAAHGTLRQISDRFGVPSSTIYNVRSRRHWRHV